jgi:arylsulfatase A-like enzyme
LGSEYGPFVAGGDPAKPDFRVRDLDFFPDVDAARLGRRREYLEAFDQVQAGLETAAPDADSEFDRAYRLVTSGQAKRAFDLSYEPDAVRARYGPRTFGQSCLLARRLVEAGVPFVKVARAWWDSHGQNFETHQELCADLDHCMSALLDDLDERGLLENTLVITLGEFGRTPGINASLGRDHFASAWSCSLSGMGIRGGVAYGKTDEEGHKVIEGEANAGDLFATILEALGIDHEHEYMLGARPIPLSDFGSKPIREVLA